MAEWEHLAFTANIVTDKLNTIERFKNRTGYKPVPNENIRKGKTMGSNYQEEEKYESREGISNINAGGSNTDDGSAEPLGRHVINGAGTIECTKYADLVYGSDIEDKIYGYEGEDTIYGMEDNDTLYGGKNNDSLYGGEGDDVIWSGTGNDNAFGENGNDYIKGKDGNDTLHGGAGNDSLWGELDNDLLWGDDGDDSLSGEDGNDTLNGGNGNDILRGGWGDDELYGEQGNDDLSGSFGNDKIFGGDGDDGLGGCDGNDYLNGGAGNDALIGNEGDDALYGCQGNDYLSGCEGNDILYGYQDNDSLDGGAGNDQLYGGTGNDLLEGKEGNDTLDGGTGNDTLYGNSGDDTYIIDSIDSLIDTIVENANEGTDTVKSSITYTLGENSNIENLTLSGTSAIDGTGNKFDNVITGNDAANTLYGGAGKDTLKGGKGNDTYIIDSLSDTIVEKANEGTDTVESSVTYTLGDNLENLTLTGTSAINGTGNTLDNVITGNSAKNVLTGGKGNDTYIIDSLSDTIVEKENEGTDTVQSSITYNLGKVSNIENLTLTGNAAINGYGNSFDNVIKGNGANSKLYGGKGNDTYIIDSAGDTIYEYAEEGTDTVKSSITYTLGDYLNNLTLTGTSAIDGTGNSLDNVITGNSADNTLYGGAGKDTLYGGKGNDTYIIDSLSDTITEYANEGIDTVQSSITYTLGDYLNNLTLTGTSAIDGTGNTFNNVITGNHAMNYLKGDDGNDTIYGYGGNDTLYGGAGNDTLYGNSGDDTYIIGITDDTIIEYVGEGTDTVESSVTYFMEDNIEKLTLTGTDAISGYGNSLDNVITGNSAANTLFGEAGNDTLYGGAGKDTLYGGTGDDTYIVDSNDDIIIDYFGEGTDTVKSSITYEIGEFVDNLTLTGTDAINGTGNTVANVITGNSANNTLTGGASNDTLNGGSGNDTLNGDDDKDILYGGDGYDTLKGGTGNDTLYGEAGNDALYGEAGNDTLDGGAGTDFLNGGKGDDTYITDGSDSIVEYANEGTDTVQSSATYTLKDNIENLILIGESSIDGTGNALNNVITGNHAKNYLKGDDGNDTIYGYGGNDTLYGGSGNDRLHGNSGDDTYIIDSEDDTIIEDANEGTDTVESSITYTLGDNVENLTLTGTDAINGTGNSYANVITGNDAANNLYGAAGNDTLYGGRGNDTYIIDSTGDTITEYAGQGTDTVESSITYTLGDNVENLTLTGTDVIIGTGNSYANVITGNSANSSLYGYEGNDTIYGGAGHEYIEGNEGNDTFNGNEGNDTFYDGIGNETYIYNLNCGNDIICDTSGNDTLYFGAGIAADSATYSQSGNDYVITITSTNETVTIRDWFVSDDYKIENIVFADSGSPDVSGVSSVSDSVFVDSTEANTVIQEMSAFNAKEVASVAGTGDTNGNQDTMMLVAGSWQG